MASRWLQKLCMHAATARTARGGGERALFGVLKVPACVCDCIVLLALELARQLVVLLLGIALRGRLQAAEDLRVL